MNATVLPVPYETFLVTSLAAQFYPTLYHTSAVCISIVHGAVWQMLFEVHNECINLSTTYECLGPIFYQFATGKLIHGTYRRDGYGTLSKINLNFA